MNPSLFYATVEKKNHLMMINSEKKDKKLLYVQNKMLFELKKCIGNWRRIFISYLSSMASSHFKAINHSRKKGEKKKENVIILSNIAKGIDSSPKLQPSLYVAPAATPWRSATRSYS